MKERTNASQHSISRGGRVARIVFRVGVIGEAATEVQATRCLPVVSTRSDQGIARLGGQDITVLFRERLALRPGETIRLAPDVGKIHLFDKASVRRI